MLHNTTSFGYTNTLFEMAMLTKYTARQSCDR